MIFWIELSSLLNIGPSENVLLVITIRTSVLSAKRRGSALRPSCTAPALLDQEKFIFHRSSALKPPLKVACDCWLQAQKLARERIQSLRRSLLTLCGWITISSRWPSLIQTTFQTVVQRSPRAPAW